MNEDEFMRDLFLNSAKMEITNHWNLLMKDIVVPYPWKKDLIY